MHQSSSYESELVLQGIIGFDDELRPGVKEAVQSLNAAGITVKMVTGDSMSTGAAVARMIGIVDDSNGHQITQQSIPVVPEEAADLKSIKAAQSLSIDVESQSLSVDKIAEIRCFCRMTPDDKLNLVRLHQTMGDLMMV